jgi:hypothetical protein
MTTSAKGQNLGATVTPMTTTPTVRTILFDDAGLMLIDQDIVPRHRPHHASVLCSLFSNDSFQRILFV